MIVGYCPARINRLISNKKKTTNLLVGVQTGHCRLKRHLSLIRTEEDAKKRNRFPLLAPYPTRTTTRYATFGARS